MRAAIAVALLAAPVACSPLAPIPDTSRYYTLAPEPPEPPAAAPPRAALATVGLGPVRLPPYLDRPQIVTRAAPERVEIASHDRWAAPLDVLFTRTLAEDLREAIPAREVLAWPWPRGAAVDWTVSVDVLRFERERDGTAVLEARWTVSRRAGAEPIERGRTLARVPAADREMASSVAALGRSLGALARDLATALARASPPPAGR